MSQIMKAEHLCPILVSEILFSEIPITTVNTRKFFNISSVIVDSCVLLQYNYYNRFSTKEVNTMALIYRKLTEKDLDTFIEMRINQLREEGAKEDIDLRPALKGYYTRHMSDGTFLSWLAVDNDKIIGTSGMSIVEKPPYFGCPSGRIGLLSSMFTDKNYRRQGIAKELLSRVVNEAKECGCGTVQITASDMGVLLYTDFGFTKNNNFMQYKL